MKENSLLMLSIGLKHNNNNNNSHNNNNNLEQKDNHIVVNNYTENLNNRLISNDNHLIKISNNQQQQQQQFPNIINVVQNGGHYNDQYYRNDGNNGRSNKVFNNNEKLAKISNHIAQHSISSSLSSTTTSNAVALFRRSSTLSTNSSLDSISISSPSTSSTLNHHHHTRNHYHHHKQHNNNNIDNNNSYNCHYDRLNISHQFNQNGYFDPYTRQNSIKNNIDGCQYSKTITSFNSDQSFNDSNSNFTRKSCLKSNQSNGLICPNPTKLSTPLIDDIGNHHHHQQQQQNIYGFSNNDKVLTTTNSDSNKSKIIVVESTNNHYPVFISNSDNNNHCLSSIIDSNKTISTNNSIQTLPTTIINGHYVTIDDNTPLLFDNNQYGQYTNGNYNHHYNYDNNDSHLSALSLLLMTKKVDLDVDNRDKKSIYLLSNNRLQTNTSATSSVSVYDLNHHHHHSPTTTTTTPTITAVAHHYSPPTFSSSSSYIAPTSATTISVNTTNTQSEPQRHPELSKQQQQQQKDSETYTELLRYRSQEFYNKLAQQQRFQSHHSPGPGSSSSCSNRTNETIYDTSTYNNHFNGQQQLQQQKLSNSQSLVNVQQLESNQNLLTLPTTNTQIQRRLTKEFESLRDLSIPPPASSTLSSTVNIADNGSRQSNHYQNSSINSSTISNHRNHFVHSHHLNHLNSSSSLLRSNSSLSLSHHQKNKGYHLLPKSNIHSGHNLLPALSSTNLSLSLMPSSTSSTSTSATTTTNGFAALATIDRRLTTSRNVIGAPVLLPSSSSSSSSSTKVMNSTNAAVNNPSGTLESHYNSSSSPTSISSGLQHAYSYQQAKVAQHIVHSTDHNGGGTIQTSQPQLKRTLAVGNSSTSAPTTPQKPLLSRSNSSNPSTASSNLQPVPIQTYPTNSHNQINNNNNLPQSTIFGHPQHYSPVSNHLSNVSLNQRHANNSNSMNISRSSNSLLTSGHNATTGNVIVGNHNQQTIHVPDHNHLYHQYGTVIVPPNVVTNNNNTNNNQHYVTNVGKLSQNQQQSTTMIQSQQISTKYNSNPNEKTNGGLTVITPCSVISTTTSSTTTTTTSSSSCNQRYTQRFPIVSLITTTATTSTTTMSTSMIQYPTQQSIYSSNVQQQQQRKITNNQPPIINSLSRSFFANSTNLFESKKNKFFGSVSSIDLQCLKESQKVSVIERKSSSNSTTTNTTSNNNNNNKIAAVSSIGGRHHGSLLKSNSSSSTTNSSSGSTGGTGGGGGSAASNFFKLFTSSSKAKIPTFGFSSSSSNNNNNNNNNNASTHNNLDQNTTNNVGGGSTSSTISSNSSLNTVTIRADSILSGSNDPESNSIDNHHLTYETTGRLDQHRQQQYKMVNGHETRLTIKSISVDSANPDNNSINQSLTATIVLEPVMPSNEILFRKYFTFYDLLSSINLHRLFVDNSISNLEGPCSSLLDLTRGTTPTNNGNNSTTTVTVNPNSNQTVTTFESSTLSSTSSYSSCTSSMSSSSHQPTTANSRPQLYQSLTKHHYSQFPVPLNQTDIGNELLAPSPNFLNEIGCERQYSIELTWNNGFKEEIPSSMLQQQQHEEVSFDSSSSYLLRNTTESSSLSNKNSSSIDVPRQFHPPSYSKRINIFSDASPFVAYTQHSVMSDLYGGANTSGTLPLNHTHSGAKKLSDLDFQDLDDGFGSLSSSSLSSTYPGMTNLVGGGSCSQSSTFQPSLQPGSHSRCPFGSTAEVCNLLEMDYGTSYYRTHFRDFEHQNWLQINDKYGPIIVSLRKERVKTSNNSAISSSSSSNHSSSSSSNSNSSNVTIRWRVIVRTTSLIPLRGTIATLPSICLPTGMPGSGSLDASNSSSRRSSNSDHFNINSVRDVLSLVVPKSVNVANFRLGSPTVISQLLKIDEMSQNTEYKIGVLYAYGNQHSEEEFYNNILDYSSSTRSSFYDFLGLISSRIRLKEFKGYKAGLDVQNDTTGEYSWTAKFGHTEIMFHVCTELPFNSTNRQQLPRKRHIGNDIVTIVFLHENFNGSPFTPALIRSKFQQVFIIVKPFQNGKYFRVAIARHKLVPLFGPPVKPYYTRQELREFILTKIINAENACHSVNKFAEMAKRTRHEYLTEMCQKHSLTQTVAHVDSSLSSNSLNSFKKLWTLSATNNSSSGNDHSSSKHRSKSELIDGNSLNQLPYVGHILNGIRDPPTLNGAILFSERCAGSSVPSRLYVHDYYANRDVEVQLLLSNEAILVIEAATMEVIWAAPVTSIIGWTDSRGVFATSSANCVISNIRQTASTSNSGGSSINKLFGDKKSKSVDSEPSANHCSMLNDSSRELRLYYHQGECIQLMQRPINPALKQNQNEPSLVNGKLSSKHQHQNIANQRNNDPFLMLIRVLELITCKSELRAIVIKRKSSATRSITSKSASNTPEHRKSSPPHSLSNIEPVGTCGGEFGFQMKMSTGIIEEIFDQTLSIYHLVPGCKVLEIDKISFAAMAMDELQELVNSSLIMCLTFTPYDFARLHPRCNCPWPKALQLQHKQKSQQTPPSDYENVTKSLTNTPLKSSSSMIVSSSFLPLQTSASSTTSLSGPNSGVKTIHITQNNSINQQIESNVPNASSPSSTNSSYYSPNTVATSNSNQQSYNNSFSIQHGQLSQQQHQLYSAKSATSLNQLYQQQSPIKIASSGQNLSSSPSTTSTSLFNHQQPYRTLLANNNRSVHSQTAITTQPSTLKDNLIRLITMDDYNQNVSPMDSPSAKSDLNDFTPLVVGIGHQTNDMSDDAAKTYYGHCHETSSRRPQTIGGGQYSITTSNTPIHNCQQQHYRYSTGPKHDTESTYSSYAPIGPTSNCRYSTSSQYSSQSRTSSGSNAQTTIHVNASHITVPVISGQQPQQQHTMLVRTGPYGKESTTDLKNSSSSSNLTSVTATSENNDCYLLTAQPVRVDASNGASITSSSTANNQPQQQQQVECVNDEIINVIAPTNTAVSNNSMMSQSYDCNSLYQSLLTGSIHSAGDPIGDIVWPSMHSSMDHHSYLQQQARSSTMTNNTDSSSSITNCDTNSSNTNLSAGSASVHQVVPPQHLTDEVRKLSLEKDVLNDTISKLREENQRLHMESQTASQQLRKLTEWFFNSNPNAVTTTASTTVCEPSPTYSSNTTNTTTISIHPKPKSITTSTPTSISTTTTEQTIQ